MYLAEEREFTLSIKASFLGEQTQKSLPDTVKCKSLPLLLQKPLHAELTRRAPPTANPAASTAPLLPAFHRIASLGRRKACFCASVSFLKAKTKSPSQEEQAEIVS